MGRNFASIQGKVKWVGRGWVGLKNDGSVHKYKKLKNTQDWPRVEMRSLFKIKIM